MLFIVNEFRKLLVHLTGIFTFFNGLF